MCACHAETGSAYELCKPFPPNCAVCFLLNCCSVSNIVDNKPSTDSVLLLKLPFVLTAVFHPVIHVRQAIQNVHCQFIIRNCHTSQAMLYGQVSGAMHILAHGLFPMHLEVTELLLKLQFPGKCARCKLVT